MVFLVLGYWRQRSFISTVRLWRWWQNGGLFVTTYTWIQLFSWSYSGRGKKKKWIIKYNWHTTSESDPCGEAVPFSGSSLAESGTIAQSAYGEQPCSLALLGFVWNEAYLGASQYCCLALVNRWPAAMETSLMFFELYQKYNETSLIISCKASVSVIFFEHVYKYFFKWQRYNSQASYSESEPLKSCAAKHVTYDCQNHRVCLCLHSPCFFSTVMWGNSMFLTFRI